MQFHLIVVCCHLKLFEKKTDLMSVCLGASIFTIILGYAK